MSKKQHTWYDGLLVLFYDARFRLIEGKHEDACTWPVTWWPMLSGAWSGVKSQGAQGIVVVTKISQRRQRRLGEDRGGCVTQRTWPGPDCESLC